MIERLIENWLANAGERGFETPFAQLLALEGHRVLQGPVHHPFEHGKDIITIGPDGAVCAFQLKGNAVSGLDEFEKIHGQLLALISTAISHAGVGRPRRPERTFLVTSGVLTAPVRDRIQQFNVGNTELGLPAVEAVEREQLVSRFVAAHGSYLPQTLPEIRSLLEFYYAEPSAVFPVRRFAIYLERLLPFATSGATRAGNKRAVASGALLTAYASNAATGAGNHLSTAQAWLTFCVTLLRFAEVKNLEESDWKGTYELAFEAARASMATIAAEAAGAPDLAVPDLTEGLFYSTRSLLICGYLSAYWLSERTVDGIDSTLTERIRAVLVREIGHWRLIGESEVPSFYEVACALSELGEISRAEQAMALMAETLAHVNARHSPNALPDPYHDVEEILWKRVSGDSAFEDEEFDGRSYMLQTVVDWLARRLCRQRLARIWPEITRVQLMEFKPSIPSAYLAPHDDDGSLEKWFVGQPQSWGALLADARSRNIGLLPRCLASRREMLPYLPLLMPYRFTTVLAAAVDGLALEPTTATN